MTLKKNVFEIVKTIPKGKVTTYKAIANMLGTNAYRSIGQILKKNNNAPAIPCHRVVNSNGDLGGYFGKHYEDKIRLLTTEGVLVENSKVVDFKKIFFNPILIKVR